MAVTTISSSNAIAAKLWSKKLWAEVANPPFWDKFISEDGNNIIHRVSDLTKEAGDQVTFGLRTRITAKGVADAGWLEDNEAQLTIYNDAVKLGRIRQAVRIDGKLSEQRTAFSLRQGAKDALRDWFWERWNEWFFNKLSGQDFQAYQGTSKGTIGSLTTVGEAAAANTNNLYGGDATSVDSIDSSDTLTLDLISKAKVAAKTGQLGGSSIYKMRPIMVDGEEYYVLILHPFVAYSLKQSSDWKDIQKNAAERGANNPIFTGALGVYDGVILYEHDQIYRTQNTGSVYYAKNLFLGAQAGLLAIAQEAPDWIEDVADFGDKPGIATGMTMGFDKAQYNSIDFGVIVLNTAATDPTS